MKEIIYITDEEKTQIKKLTEAVQSAYNHAHFALDKIIVVSQQLEYGKELDISHLVNILNDAATDIKAARSYNGLLLNHLNGKG